MQGGGGSARAACWAWYLSRDRRCQEESRPLPISQEYLYLLAVVFITPLHRSVAPACGKPRSPFPSEQFNVSPRTFLFPCSQVPAAAAHWSQPSAEGSI